MNEVELIRRYNVSPTYLAETREKFIPMEFLKPKQYDNACRYKNLRRIQDPETKKIYHETWFQKIVDESNEDQYMIVSIAEEGRLDIIANQYYNTPRFWWVIALANNIIDPFDIPIGTTLRIPVIVSLYNQGGVLSNG